MRYILFLFFISVVPVRSYSQAPSKAQMQAQMQEAVNELNNQIAETEKQLAEAKKNKEDADTIKDLEDQLAMLKKQLAMMGGVSKGLSRMSDKVVQKAIEQEEDNNTDAIPAKDTRRIKMIPDKILSNAELLPYIKNITTEVEARVSPDSKKIAAKLASGITDKENYNKHLAEIANACWMNGYPELAISLMGKVCVADTGNGINLNNYAAFLIMAGAEHAALPILQKLDQRYPDNSTVLNNMAQAWFGLGDTANANKYLDKTISIYKNHPQANETKSKIEKAEGKTEESIESLKRSVKENYTPEKEARLNELGYELKYEDIDFRYPVKAEPLGIEQLIFSIPAYPFAGGTEAEESRMEWDDFREKVTQKLAALNTEFNAIKPKAENFSKRLLANPLISLPYKNNIYQTAVRKRDLLIQEWSLRSYEFSKKLMAAGDTVEIWRTEYGKASTNNLSCAANLALATAFQSKANALWQQRNTEWINFQKEYLNARAGLELYANLDPSLYELNLNSIKNVFLTLLLNLHCEFAWGCIPTKPVKPTGKVLPDFDSVNCQYHDEFSIPPFTHFKFECNKMSTEFNVGINFNYGLEISPFVKLGWDEDLKNNTTLTPSNIIKGFVEAGAEIGAGKLQGPGLHEAEAKAEGAIGMEFTREGLESVYIKAKAKVDVGPSVEGDNEITNYIPAAGVETEVKWNAGNEKVKPSLEGKLEGSGFLSGIHLSTGSIK